jgi:integrase
MGAVHALLTWAKGDGLITANPMAEVSNVRLPTIPKTRSKAFTNDEVLTILKATLEPSVSREGEHLRNAKRWCPWLMAYSGARVNEITQLRKEDIFNKDGMWIMRITPDAGRVKTKAYRLVPLHSHLVDQGFLKFVEGRPKGPLFFDPTKRRSDNASIGNPIGWGRSWRLGSTRLGSMG